eukprot:1044678_1
MSSPYQSREDTTLTKVFVGGLSFQTSSESLQAHFSKFGPIREAVVIFDKQNGRSKGYGFVTFDDPVSAQKATSNPNPIIDNRRANCILAALGAKKNGNKPHRYSSRRNPSVASSISSLSSLASTPTSQYMVAANQCYFYGYPQSGIPMRQSPDIPLTPTTYGYSTPSNTGYSTPYATTPTAAYAGPASGLAGFQSQATGTPTAFALQPPLISMGARAVGAEAGAAGACSLTPSPPASLSATQTVPGEDGETPRGEGEGEVCELSERMSKLKMNSGVISSNAVPRPVSGPGALRVNTTLANSPAAVDLGPGTVGGAYYMQQYQAACVSPMDASMQMMAMPTRRTTCRLSCRICSACRTASPHRTWFPVSWAAKCTLPASRRPRCTATQAHRSVWQGNLGHRWVAHWTRWAARHGVRRWRSK